MGTDVDVYCDCCGDQMYEDIICKKCAKREYGLSKAIEERLSFLEKENIDLKIQLDKQTPGLFIPFDKIVSVKEI